MTAIKTNRPIVSLRRSVIGERMRREVVLLAAIGASRIWNAIGIGHFLRAKEQSLAMNRQPRLAGLACASASKAWGGAAIGAAHLESVGSFHSHQRPMRSRQEIAAAAKPAPKSKAKMQASFIAAGPTTGTNTNPCRTR